MGARSRIPDEALLDAARDVLMRDGVGATTAAVAEHAGVSEALLFKRFGSKEALVQAAMAAERPAWMAIVDAAEGAGDLRGHLEAVGIGMIESLRQEMPRAMMLWSKSPGEHFAGPGDPPPVAGMKRLSTWFEREMRLGRMRRTDPEILARVFSGAIVAYAMSEMTGLAVHMPLASTTFVRGLVDALWFGASPTSTR